MKSFGDTQTAICHNDGRVTVTYLYQDVKIRHTNVVVKDQLVGVCDVCHEVILVPSECTPFIAAAIQEHDAQTQ